MGDALIVAALLLAPTRALVWSRLTEMMALHRLEVYFWSLGIYMDHPDLVFALTIASSLAH